MSNFAEMAAADIAIFLTEFGDAHEVGGVALPYAIVDTEMQQPLQTPDGGPQRWRGQGRRVTTCYVPQAAWLAGMGTADYRAAAPVGGLLTLDGIAMTVLSATPEDGLLRLELETATTGGAMTRCTVKHYTAGDGLNEPTMMSQETNIACRFAWRQQVVMSHGREAVSEAEVAFPAACGLVALAVGDGIVLAGHVERRVLSVHEERDLAGVLRERVAWVGR